MNVPQSIRCEKCETDSPVVMIRGSETDHWPKSTMRPTGFHVFIKCPKCGEREQCVAPHDGDRS